MQLIASLTSPFARKIRILLLGKVHSHQAGGRYSWNADTQVPHYNPLGKVPVLVSDAGQPIYDSPVIAEYLDTVVSELLFLPDDRRRAIDVKLRRGAGRRHRRLPR